MHVNQSSVTGNTTLGMLMRTSNDGSVHVTDSLHGHLNQFSQFSQNNQTGPVNHSMVLRSLEAVNESYANLNPCLES